MATDALGFYLLLDFSRMLGKGEKINEGIKKHHECLKSVGATATFEYWHPEVVKNIVGEVDTLDVYLAIGFDAITENDIPQLSADILSTTGHGKSKLVLTLPWPEDYTNLEDVEVFKSAPALLGTNAQDYVVIASPVAIIQGGIASAQKFFDMLKEGISGKKLVVKVEYLGRLRGVLSVGKGVVREFLGCFGDA
ncbi:uncharacterized protein EAF02_009808 [Botrytis sinoallii]|uniref:uncharacterized protein n=1 Tax=Botrytis sinoallii TaxID=1463999 RepID=UPI001901364D|nr:uncharacterized protein EAF02_009808 [Botrytis sinoallii]KAF7867022.1 hypothetical protein EAF02_009808 [Botrytis sinoallii]